MEGARERFPRLGKKWNRMWGNCDRVSSELSNTRVPLDPNINTHLFSMSLSPLSHTHFLLSLHAFRAGRLNHPLAGEVTGGSKQATHVHMRARLASHRVTCSFLSDNKPALQSQELLFYVWGVLNGKLIGCEQCDTSANPELTYKMARTSLEWNNYPVFCYTKKTWAISPTF